MYSDRHNPPKRENMLKNYLLTAWRHLVKNKVYSIVNLFGLSIGLAAVMLIVLYVKDEVSFDHFQTNGRNIYRLVHNALDPTGHEQKGGSTGAPQAGAFLRSIPEVQAACRIRESGQQLVKKGNDIIPEYAVYADTSFFHVFTFPLIHGNAALALSSEDNIVLSEDLAKKYFNTTDAIGRTMEINENGEFHTFTVSAVAANTPLNSSIRFDMLLPIERSLHGAWTQAWTNAYLNTFFIIKPGSDIKAVEKKMTSIFDQNTARQFAELRKKYPNIYYNYGLQPFLKIHLDKAYNANNGINHWSDVSYSYTLGSIALFILLIACINFINLTLARSLRRGKEIGIRKVAGGSRGQLITQFMSESLILNLLAFIPSLLLVQVCLPWFSELANKQLSVSYLFHTSTLLLFGALILCNTLLSGFYPALVLSGFRPVQTLYGKFRLTGRNYLGKSLVIIQFVIAVFLIIGTIVMQQQFRFMSKKDPGYRTAGIVDVSLPDVPDKKIDLLRSELAKYPFIRQSAVESIGFTNSNWTQMQVNNHDVFDVPFYRMDEFTLPMLKIPFVAGRNFLGGAADSGDCIINETMALASGWKNPIGQRISWDKHDYTIIGIVKDFHMASMRAKISPAFITKGNIDYYGNMIVSIDPNRKVDAIRSIQSTYKKLYPNNPCDYAFLDDMLVGQYKSEQRWMTIITTAAVLAIFISCLGLFGLATLSIEQRVKEIGVRKVLGASLVDITSLLSKDFVRLVVIAFVIASPAAWYFYNKWLQDFAYRIHLSWSLFLIVGLSTLAISFFTVSIRAASAALANPAASLRSE